MKRLKRGSGARFDGGFECGFNRWFDGGFDGWPGGNNGAGASLECFDGTNGGKAGVVVDIGLAYASVVFFAVSKIAKSITIFVGS